MVWIKIKLKSLVLKQHLKCYQCSPEELVNHAVSYLEDRGVEFKIATQSLLVTKKVLVEVDGENNN